jgi:nitroreductase/NAD-dependent dihydropyrimidine dehydrogenase PreA subunit
MPGTHDPPRVNPEACTGCGLCREACPSFVFDLREGKAQVVRGDWCIGCGHCSALCPTGAVFQRETYTDISAPEGPTVTPEALKLLLRQRRSVRLYRPEPVPSHLLEHILDGARYTPTGTNSQNVRYLVVTSAEILNELRRRTESFYRRLFRMAGTWWGGLLISLASGSRMRDFLRGYLPMVRHAETSGNDSLDPILHHAPALILAHAEAWDPCSAFNCAAALYSASLLAHSLGLGCCFNGFVEGAVNHSRGIRQWLGIPRDHRCYGAMTVGFPAVTYRKLVERRPAAVRWW